MHPPELKSDEAIELAAGLPGEELVVPGIRDLEAGHWSAEAFLLLIARGRLMRAGFGFLKIIEPPEGETESLLYSALEERDQATAYSTYNSWKRRLDSFVRCLEQRVSIASK